MADYRFSFHEKNKEYSPAWLAPEGLLNYWYFYNLYTWTFIWDYHVYMVSHIAWLLIGLQLYP